MSEPEKDKLLKLLSVPGTDVEFAEANLHILDKRKRLVPLRPNRIQLHLDSRLTGRDLVLKSRQIGVSTWLQAKGHRLVTTSSAAAATICDEDKNTQRFRRWADRFYENQPAPKPVRKYNNAGLTTYPALNSESEIYTAGNKKTGRSGTYSFVHGSEVAFWNNAEDILAGLMQGVPEEGMIILESTPNGAQGWFYEQCLEALDGNSNWTLHFYPWWWDDNYQLPIPEGEPLTYTDEEQALVTAHGLTQEQIQWRRKKQHDLKRLFFQEYPEDPHTCFLVSGNSYFADIDHLEAVFTAPVDAVYDPTHRYVAGLDFGQMKDYTAMSIIDETTRQEVALLRWNQMPWAEMRRRVCVACRTWGVRRLFAEANSMGTTNIEALENELIEYGANHTGLFPFYTSAQSKPPLISGFHHAIDEEGLKLLPDPVGRQEINSFVASQTASGAWTYGAEQGHDDTVIARAQAAYALHANRMILGTAPDEFADWRG